MWHGLRVRLHFSGTSPSAELFIRKSSRSRGRLRARGYKGAQNSSLSRDFDPEVFGDFFFDLFGELFVDTLGLDAGGLNGDDRSWGC